MLKHWFEYTDDWRLVPMAYWVYIPSHGKHWRDEDAEFQPPAPRRRAQGYLVLCIEVRDVVLQFTSAEQLRVFVETLSMKPLPSTRRLSELRGTRHGPNSHWLSRLPAWMKGPAFRKKMLPKIVRLADEVSGTDVWDRHVP